jgi:repressor LexA
MKLTSRQHEVLSAIKELTTKKGYAPTLNEIKDFLGYKRTSSVQRHTDALKAKGYLSSEKHQPRSMKIDKNISEKYNIPLVGTVTCGKPILAIENIEAYIPYPIKGDPNEDFFLRAVGDSMDLAGIKDGAFVLVKKQQAADSGDKVVVLMDDEATIKVYKEDKDKIVLEPKSSNPMHKPIYIFEDVQIQGKVIEVINNK